jgi:hypothetical protein
MAPFKQNKQEFGIACDGGLKLAEQLLRLRDIEDLEPDLFSDVVFMSIDLEVSRQERVKPGVPLVKEFGMATFDTRDALKCISTQQFSTSHASQDFLDCDCTDFKECVFAETFYVSQADLPTTISKCLCIQDTSSLDPLALRNIVIVGHSPRGDLKILKGLGVDVYEIAPVLAILDTHLMARNMFGVNSISLKGTNFII